MTVGQSLIEWLYTFGNIEIDESVIIETDQVDAEAGSYGLYKEPTKTITQFIDGSRDVAERYYLVVRQASKTNPDRVSNQAWMEALERWVFKQNLSRNLPTLDEEHQCYGVSIAVSAYMAETETDTAAYQVSFEINYQEEILDAESNS